MPPADIAATLAAALLLPLLLQPSIAAALNAPYLRREMAAPAALLLLLLPSPAHAAAQARACERWDSCHAWAASLVVHARRSPLFVRGVRLEACEMGVFGRRGRAPVADVCGVCA